MRRGNYVTNLEIAFNVTINNLKNVVKETVGRLEVGGGVGQRRKELRIVGENLGEKSRSFSVGL